MLNKEVYEISHLPPKIFICYSHSDKEFVKILVNDLTINKIIVWWDDWEINVGDSLINKIEDGIKTSSFLGIVMTPNSISSKWVREELNAGIIQQLENRSIFILPILLIDCEIPLFLKDKKYADFRDDYSRGFEQLLTVLKGQSVFIPGRIDAADFHHDYAIDWGKFDGKFGFIIFITSHGNEFPYSVLSEVFLKVDSKYSRRLDDLYNSGIDWGPRALLLSLLAQNLIKFESNLLIEGEKPAFYKTGIVDPKLGFESIFQIKSRVLGNIQANPILFDWKSMVEIVISNLFENIQNTYGKDGLEKFRDWLNHHPLE